jgi:hypothetical protein
MEFLLDFKFAFLNIFLLIIWFNTDVFYEYFKYISYFYNLFKFKQFEEFRFSHDEIYPNFLVIKYNNFFTKLISCPKCINFWITLVQVPFFNSIYSVFSIYTIGLLLYNIYLILEKYGTTDN